MPEGTAGTASGTEAGAVILPKSIEPKPKEEGLIDKLKFWKKDPQAAEAKPELKPAAKSELKEVAPIELPKTGAPGADVSEPAGDTPSVLVVPIGGVAPSVPEANAPEAVAPPVVEEPKAEPPKKVEPVKSELPKAAPIKPAEPSPIGSAPTAKPKKADVPPPPTEEEPGFFERMLEKIGF